VAITEQAPRVRRYRLNTPLSSPVPGLSGQFTACSRRPERAAQTCKIASAARPTSVAPLGASTQGGHHPSPYCWYGTTASPMRTGLFCGPPPVTSSRST
jgi:hypothetical protein